MSSHHSCIPGSRIEEEKKKGGQRHIPVSFMGNPWELLYDMLAYGHANSKNGGNIRFIFTHLKKVTSVSVEGWVMNRGICVYVCCDFSH